MDLRSILAVYQKELLHYSRDRRTIVSLVLAPIIVNFLLMAGVSYFFERSAKQAQEEKLTVALQQNAPMPGLAGVLREAGLVVHESRDAKAEAAAKQSTLGIVVETSAGKPSVRVYGDFTPTEGMVRRSRIERALSQLKEQQVRAELARAGLPESILTPFAQAISDVAPPAKSAGFLIGNLLPVLLLQFLFVGAVYPAVDMTAGEKERRTIEMTLTAPIRREELVLGKLLAVVTSCVLATTVSLISLMLTFRSLTSRPGKGPWAALQHFSLDPATVGLLLIALLPMMFLLAAGTLAVGASARSAQEANSYVTPMLLLILILSFVSFLPGFHLDFRTALVPVANFALLIRQVLTGESSGPVALLAFAANAFYAALAVWIAVRAFQRESVLFRG